MTHLATLKNAAFAASFALAIAASSYCSAAVMYSNDFLFSDGAQADWTVVSGTDGWSVLDPSGYNYGYEDPGITTLGLSVYSSGALASGDYSVHSVFSRETDNFGGIVFRYQDSSNFYLGRIALAQKLQLYKFSGGTGTLLGEAALAEPNYSDSGDWKLVVSASGSDLSVSAFDETNKFMGAVGATDATFSSGTFGYRVDPGYTFNNVTVEDPFDELVIKTINVVDDTYVCYDSRTLSPVPMDTNYGTKVSCEIKSASSGTTTIHRKAYFKFDVSELDAADQASFIVNAYAVNSSSYTFRLYGLIDGVGDDWGETTITWNNAPGNTAASNDMDSAETVFLGTFKGAAGDAAFSGSTLVDFLNADSDGLVTLIVAADQTSTNISYAATPFRALEYATVNPNWTLYTRLKVVSIPEPGVALMLLCGFAALAALKLHTRRT